jgi:hypothetical protein
VLVNIGSILRSTKVYGAFMFPNIANFYIEGAWRYGGSRTCEAYKAVSAGGGRTVVRFIERHHRVGSFDL